jgi:3-carboxy-cis,cis-muconate cycloisomerase
MLLVNRACEAMSADHRTLSATLRSLSDRHKDDVMLGRTLLQPASPITFGLKVAGWFAAEGRGWQRVETRCREAAVLQFGGASGTLASLGDQGLRVAEAWARELGLRCPPGPWQAYADNIAALVAACGVYAGTLGKIARDITLLMQFEVGELHEPGGGSSSMPQKRNPSGSVVALAAAARLSGLVATAMSTLTQEHERAAGAWQVEWPTVADALQATGASLAAMAQVASGLHVDPARMRANLDATHGTVLTERVTQSATRALGHDRARALVKAAIDRARGEGVSFSSAVRGAPELASVLSGDDLASLDDPRRHLGLAEIFRQRLLASIESR